LVPLELSVAQDKDARTAAVENRLRSHIGEAFDAARKAKGLSIRALAKEMGTSISQVQRMLHEDIGGGLTLRTLVRGADVLGLSVSFHLEPQEQAYARDALESLKRWEGKLLSSMMLPHELLEEKPHGER
jgi:transcriptional regulator with XRE-family HTH domain